MSTIAKFLLIPPDQFSTQIASATVAADALSVTLDSTSGLPTEGVGQFFKKDANGALVSGSVEFCHWTNVAGNTITFSDTGDRGITGSDSGAQSYVADDYFEVWVSSYYVGGYGGVVEHTSAGLHNYATAGEVTTGTATDKVVNPDKLAGSDYGKRVVSLIIFDDATSVVTGDGAGDLYYRVPSVMNGWNLVGIAAKVGTAGTTGNTDIMIYNVTDSQDMLSTAMRVETGETDTSTSAQPGTINTTYDDVATGDKLRIDIDAVQTTAPLGLLVELTFQLP